MKLMVSMAIGANADVDLMAKKMVMPMKKMAMPMKKMVMMIHLSWVSLTLEEKK